LRFWIIYKVLALLGVERERKADERDVCARLEGDIPLELTIAIFLIGRELWKGAQAHGASSLFEGVILLERRRYCATSCSNLEKLSYMRIGGRGRSNR